MFGPTQALITKRINLSPFTKDFRAIGALLELSLYLEATSHAEEAITTLNPSKVDTKVRMRALGV